MISNTSTQRDIQAEIYNKLESLDANQLMLLSLVIDEIRSSNKNTLEALANIKDALNGVKVIEKEKVVEKEVIKEVKVPMTDTEMGKWFQQFVNAIPYFKSILEHSYEKCTGLKFVYANLGEILNGLGYRNKKFEGDLNDYFGLTKWMVECREEEQEARAEKARLDAQKREDDAKAKRMREMYTGVYPFDRNPQDYCICK